MAEQIIDPMTRFEKAKSQAKQETFASKQAAQEAINRRFAQMGMQGSGASIKQQSLIDQQSEEELGKRLEGISGMQEQEIGRLNEIKQAREYQTKEREAGQEYGNLMLKKQQDYATKEREAGQGFASAMNKEAQDHAGRLQDKQYAFSQFMDDRQGDRFSIQMKAESDKLDYDKVIGDFNMKMANSEAGKKDMFQKAEGFMNFPKTPEALREQLIYSSLGAGVISRVPQLKNKADELRKNIFGGKI
jgi:hypothetical protein